MKKELGNSKVYLDTSAIIPFYFKEVFSSLAQNIFNDSEGFVISELSKIEFYSSVRKKIRMLQTSDSEANKVFRVFESHVNQGLYTVQSLSERDYDAATHIIKVTKYSLRSLDALHLGVAYAQGLTILSFDQTLNETAREFGIEVLEV